MAAVATLRDTYGHDAVHVAEIGLRAAEDAHVAAAARGEDRAVVTENVADFAAERDLVLVFVFKKNLPAGGGQAAALAKVLDRWAQEHPDPYLALTGPQRSAPRTLIARGEAVRPGRAGRDLTAHLTSEAAAGNRAVRQTRPMSKRPDIEAVVIPPSVSGVVLLTGAAELVTDAILDLELDVDYVQREVTQDGAGITCVRVDLAGGLLEEVQHRIENALVTLIEETSELAGWNTRLGTFGLRCPGTGAPGTAG